MVQNSFKKLTFRLTNIVNVLVIRTLEFIDNVSLEKRWYGSFEAHVLFNFCCPVRWFEVDVMLFHLSADFTLKPFRWLAYVRYHKKKHLNRVIE